MTILMVLMNLFMCISFLTGSSPSCEPADAITGPPSQPTSSGASGIRRCLIDSRSRRVIGLGWIHQTCLLPLQPSQIVTKARGSSEKLRRSFGLTTQRMQGTRKAQDAPTEITEGGEQEIGRDLS